MLFRCYWAPKIKILKRGKSFFYTFGTSKRWYLITTTQHSIVDPKVRVRRSSIAQKGCQSLYFREKISSHHWHAPFKSNTALEKVIWCGRPFMHPCKNHFRMTQNMKYRVCLHFFPHKNYFVAKPWCSYSFHNSSLNLFLGGS